MDINPISSQYSCISFFLTQCKFLFYLKVGGGQLESRCYFSQHTHPVIFLLGLFYLGIFHCKCIFIFLFRRFGERVKELTNKESLSRVLHCSETDTRWKCRKHEPQVSVFYVS